MSNAKSSSGLTDQLHGVVDSIVRFAPLLFSLLLAGAYSFIVLQIFQARSATPKPSDVAAQTQSTAVPRVDPKTIRDIQSLQDHSVNVKTLFDGARSNPFHE